MLFCLSLNLYIIFELIKCAENFTGNIEKPIKMEFKHKKTDEISRLNFQKIIGENIKVKISALYLLEKINIDCWNILKMVSLLTFNTECIKNLIKSDNFKEMTTLMENLHVNNGIEVSNEFVNRTKKYFKSINNQTIVNVVKEIVVGQNFQENCSLILSLARFMDLKLFHSNFVVNLTTTYNINMFEYNFSLRSYARCEYLQENQLENNNDKTFIEFLHQIKKEDIKMKICILKPNNCIKLSMKYSIPFIDSLFEIASTSLGAQVKNEEDDPYLPADEFLFILGIKIYQNTKGEHHIPMTVKSVRRNAGVDF